MYIRLMGREPDQEARFDPKHLGVHRERGWVIYGKERKRQDAGDGPGLVREFCAVKYPGTRREIAWVAGSFEGGIAASSEEAYQEFIELFPPRLVNALQK